MPRRRSGRFVLEALFLAAVATALTIAELRPAAVIALMALAWVIVAVARMGKAWLDEPHYDLRAAAAVLMPPGALPPPRAIEQVGPLRTAVLDPAASRRSTRRSPNGHSRSRPGRSSTPRRPTRRPRSGSPVSPPATATGPTTTTTSPRRCRAQGSRRRPGSPRRRSCCPRLHPRPRARLRFTPTRSWRGRSRRSTPCRGPPTRKRRRRSPRPQSRSSSLWASGSRADPADRRAEARARGRPRGRAGEATAPLSSSLARRRPSITSTPSPRPSVAGVSDVRSRGP